MNFTIERQTQHAVADGIRALAAMIRAKPWRKHADVYLRMRRYNRAVRAGQIPNVEYGYPEYPLHALGPVCVATTHPPRGRLP